MWRSLHIVFSALLVSCLILSSGCSNSFESFADKTNDEALLYTALEQIRNGQYADAILTCQSFPASRASDENYVMACATAYGGSCGMNFVTLVQRVDTFFDTNPGGGFLEYLMTLEDTDSQSTASIDHCDSAIDAIRGLGEASARSTEANAFMAMLGIQTIVRAYNNVGDNNGGDPDDGAIPGSFDACGGAADFTGGQQNTLTLAMWEMKKSANALSSPGNAWEDVDNGLTAICAAVVAANGGDSNYDFCAAADTTFSAQEISGAITATREGAAFGVDEDENGNNPASYLCP